MAFTPGMQLRLEFDEVEQEIEAKREIALTDEQKQEQEEQNAEDEEISEDLKRKRAQERAIKAQQAAFAKSYDTTTAESVQPHVWMLSSGEMTPFTLYIVNAEDSDNQIIIEGDELGRVKIRDRQEDDDED